MDRVKISYSNKLEYILVGDEKLDIKPIADKPIAEWFRPSNERSGWQGLLREIYDMLADDGAELQFEFSGTAEYKAVFEDCLRKNGITQAEDNIPDEAIAEECYRDAQKAQHRGNYAAAFPKYEAAAHKGHAEAQFQMGEYYSGRYPEVELNTDNNGSGCGMV